MITRTSRVDVMHRLGCAMANPTRSFILEMLTHGAVYPADIAEALGVSRTNVSNHLAYLRHCGLVTAEEEGRYLRYDLVSRDLKEALEKLVAVQLVSGAAESWPGWNDYA